MQSKMKQPSLLMSILLLLLIAFLLIYGIMIAEYQVQFILILSGVVASIFAVLHGESWKNIIEIMSSKMKSGLLLFLVLLSVGLIIGTWMMSGTIPYLVYFGIKIISPQYLYVMSFFAAAIVSICVGSSFSSVGTIGVAIMGVATAMDVNLAIAAGAIVSGAYFGDKLSPLSDTVIMASLISEVDVYQHIRHLLYTTIPSMIVSVVVFFIVGLKIDTTGSQLSNIDDMNSTLQQLFNMNLILLIPPVIVLVGSLMKKHVLIVLFLSSVVAMLIALIMQHYPLKLVIDAGIEGFNSDMLDAVLPNFETGQISDEVEELLNAGGVASMDSTILTLFCAFFFAAAIEGSRALKVVISKTLNLIESATNTILVSLLSGLAIILSTGNGTVTFFLMKDLFGEQYSKRGLHQLNLSRSMEDSGAIPEAAFPWTSAAVYMTTTLGVSTLDYGPWAIFNLLGIVFSALLAILGPHINWFGIKRVKLGSKETGNLEKKKTALKA